METINAYEMMGDSEEIKYGDFNGEQQESYDSVGSSSENEAAILYARRKKTDLISSVITVGANAIPILTDVYKHRKDPTPYRVDRNELICFGIASAIPIFQAVDTVLLKGKCQDKIDEKLKGVVKFNDIRNIVNLINLYTPMHTVIKQATDQASAKANGTQVLPIDKFAKTKAILGVTTLVTPFIADKLSDNTKSFYSRIGSILPIPFIGSLIRSTVSKSSSPTVQGAYQITNAVLNVANNANRTLTPAVRTTPIGNSVNKVSSELDSAISFASQILGTPRGNIGNSMYGGGGYQNDWRYTSF